jgi:hypothetical protein
VWLIYFNLRLIRELFAAGGAPALYEPLPYTAESRVERSGRSAIEILLTCLAVIYVFGAVSDVVMAFVQLLLFFLGFIVRGLPASVFSIVLFGINAGLAVGILRRSRLARKVAIAFVLRSNPLASQVSGLAW